MLLSFLLLLHREKGVSLLLLIKIRLDLSRMLLCLSEGADPVTEFISLLTSAVFTTLYVVSLVMDPNQRRAPVSFSSVEVRLLNLLLQSF